MVVIMMRPNCTGSIPTDLTIGRKIGVVAVLTVGSMNMPATIRSHDDEHQGDGIRGEGGQEDGDGLGRLVEMMTWPKRRSR
jgi:hypothetical protein